MGLFVAAGLSFGVACCVSPNPVYVATPLPAPTKPVLPEIQGADLQCLTPASYQALVQRDRQRAAYEATLLSVICSTRPKGCASN